MKQFFQDIYIDSIMTFLKEINLFNKFNLVIFKNIVYNFNICISL